MNLKTLAVLLALAVSATLGAVTAAEYQAAGNALVKQGKLSEAIAQYDKSLSMNPDNPKLKEYVGMLRARLGGSASDAPSGAAGGKGPVAVVYSEYARAWMNSKGKNPDNVLNAVKGAEKALAKLGYAFTRISDKDVESGRLAAFKAAVLPDSTGMSMKEQKALAAFNASGKGILMVWGYGAFDENSMDQMDHSSLEKVFGLKFTGWQGDPQVGQGPFDQYFWYSKDDKSHPVGQGLPDRILYAAGEGNTVQLAGATSVYQFMNKDKKTLVGGTAVSAYDNGRGRAVYIGGYTCAQIGDTDPDTPHDLLIRLFGSALKWVAKM
jgi:hypothetical protein